MNKSSLVTRRDAGTGMTGGRIFVLAAVFLALGLSTARAENGSTESISPLVVASADSSVSLRLQFVGRLRADWRDVEQGGDDEREQTFLMKARRVRPSMTVSLPEQRMTFRLHLSMAPGSIELMDFYFNYGLNDNIQIRAGQYKIPFTRYRIQSFQRLTFIDWSLVSQYFGSERQTGITLHNGYERPAGLGYEIGLFTGANARASHAIGLARIYGEEVVNPSDLADAGPSGDLHPELVAHVSYNEDGIDVRSDSDDSDSDWRYSLGLSGAWDFDPVEYQDLAGRVAPELLIKGHGASATVIGYAGFVGLDESQRTRLAMTGLLAQMSYRLSERWELALRYAIADFDDYIVNDAYYRGLDLIAVAEDQLDEDMASQYEEAGTILREQELTAGLNVYILGHSIKWQSDCGWYRHTLRTGDPFDDFCISSLLQIAF